MRSELGGEGARPLTARLLPPQYGVTTLLYGTIPDTRAVHLPLGAPLKTRETRAEPSKSLVMVTVLPC